MSEAYFAKVKESAVQDIITSAKGGRNETLNKAAYSLGRHAHLAPAMIEAAIMEMIGAAKQSGLNELECKSTIASGFKRGGENPKQLENSDAMPYTPSEFDRLVGRLAQAEIIAKDDETRELKMKKAREQWERAVPISKENLEVVRPAALYLNSRAINARMAVGVARFSPNVYDGPAIIFPAVNDHGEVQGVQAVLLTPDGKKREHNGISKYSRGVISGNVMRIDADGAASIIICEGPEDALSLRQAAGDDATIVCTFGKAGMSTFNPPRASDVTICADPDLDVEKVADVLRGDGSTSVHVVRFDQLGMGNVKDANDFIKEAGAEKLREALAMAKPVDVIVQERIEGERQWPTPYKPIDPTLIPPRRWIYGRHYIRSNVSVLAAAGGVGKTSMQTVEVLSIATGRELLGEPVHERCNVWMLNLEDPLEEMQRRIAAAMIYYKVRPSDIEGRIFMDAGRDLNIKFATQGRDGILTNSEMIEYMIAKINECNIGLVIIDPWVGANEINENDNSAMNAAVAAVRGVADATDCAIALTHHIRKGNGDEATVDSVRGAGSLIGAARAARVINKVSEDTALKLGVSEDQARGLFRVDDGKANLSSPADKAVYCRMEGVQLPNLEYVGVAVPFTVPDLFDGVTVKHAKEVQTRVGAAERIDEPYRQSVQAKNWVGAVAAEVIGLDLEKRSDKAKAKSIVKTWIDKDVLRVEQWHDKKKGRETTIVVVGEWITREEAGET